LARAIGPGRHSVVGAGPGSGLELALVRRVRHKGDRQKGTFLDAESRCETENPRGTRTPKRGNREVEHKSWTREPFGFWEKGGDVKSTSKTDEFV
jgi:hypothetical protein